MRDLEKQLHEQYAINANSNFSSMLTIVVALISVVATYGYVLIHTKLDVDDLQFINNTCGSSQDESYTPMALVLTALAAMGVLIILFYISLKIGFQQRKEQFITFSIRCKYYGYNYDEMCEVYPHYYHPFKKCFFTYVQGLYNFSLLVYSIIYVIIATITIKTAYRTPGDLCIRERVFVSFSIIMAIYVLIEYVCSFCSYKSLHRYYYDQKVKIKKVVDGFELKKECKCKIDLLLKSFCILLLLFSCCSHSHSQTIYVYKDGAVVKEYSSAEVDSVVYKPAAAQPRYYYYAGWTKPSESNLEELAKSVNEITGHQHGGEVDTSKTYSRDNVLYNYTTNATMLENDSKLQYYVVIPNSINGHVFNIYDAMYNKDNSFIEQDSIEIPNHKVFLSAKAWSQIKANILF